MQSPRRYSFGFGTRGGPAGEPIRPLWLLVFLLCSALLRFAAVPSAQAQQAAATPSTEFQLSVPQTDGDDEVVYLDSNGFIRVWDPQPPSDGSIGEWVSPVGGWRMMTLADVNLDGDAEIIAVGGEAYSGQLVIYDPVIGSGTVDADKITNGIPWAILYESPLPGRPLFVRTGEFDRTVPGDEIAFVYELNPEDKTDSDDETRLALWHAIAADGQSVDGTRWQDMALFVDVGITWEAFAVGDLDNAPRDEFVLVDDSVGLVRVYRLEDTIENDRSVTELNLLYENKSVERPWLDGVVARFVPGVLPQLALARSSGPGGLTFWVLFYDPGSEAGFGDSYAEFLLPPPRKVFAGDIDGNGDDELFLLRDVPTSAGGRPHLIMRDYSGGASTLPIFEQILDVDNGYTAGATGDTDGDGRAEVIIMRNNNLRIYTTPESGAATAINFTPPAITGQQVVAAANLDRNGFLKIPELGVSPPQLNTLSVYMGEVRTAQLRLSTLPTGAEGPIPFTLALPDNPTWLTVTPESGETTATVTVQVDASMLAAGTYETAIVVSSPDPTVDNSPFVVDVTVTVLPGLVVTSKSLLVPLQCGAAEGNKTTQLVLDGPAGLIFSATIDATAAAATRTGEMLVTATPVWQQAPATPHVVWPSALDWVVASSPNLLPTTMELTFHSESLAADATAGSAKLMLIFFDSLGRQVRTVDLGFFCADQQLYIPIVRQ